MKALVVYDSKFGNTERLARAVAKTLATDESAVVAAADASERDLEGIDLLVVGGPTQAHGISPALKAFLDGLPPRAVRGMPTVTFDTRLPWPRLLSGSAATAIAKRLTRKGAQLLLPPESFLVTASEGPLAEGEEARAQAWANEIRSVANRSTLEPTGAMA